MFAIELKAKHVSYNKIMNSIPNKEWKKGKKQVKAITNESLSLFKPDSVENLHKIVFLIEPLYFGGKNKDLEWTGKMEPEEILNGIRERLEPRPDFGAI
ncbi:MAG: hypothetical protein ACTSRK_20000 [Promethearchaeota archaeon]